MSALFDTVSSVGWLVYLLTFTFMFLETSGLPLPALSFALLAAALAGSGQLSFVFVLLATILGATLGGPVGHALGLRRGRPLLEQIGGRVHLTPERLDATQEQFEKRGKAILVSRFFIPILPWSAGIFAGIVRMPRRTLVLYTFIGITLWSVIELTIVAYFSSVLKDIFARISISALFWVATGVAGTIILIRIFRRRRAARRAAMAIVDGEFAEEEPADEAELPATTSAPMSSSVAMTADAPADLAPAVPPAEAAMSESGPAAESMEQEADKLH